MVKLIRRDEVTDDRIYWEISCIYIDDNDDRNESLLKVIKHQNGNWSVEDEDGMTISGDNLDMLQHYRWNIDLYNELVEASIELVKEGKDIKSLDIEDDILNIFDLSEKPSRSENIISIEIYKDQKSEVQKYTSYFYQCECPESYTGEIEIREYVKGFGTNVDTSDILSLGFGTDFVVDGNILMISADQDDLSDTYYECIEEIDEQWKDRDKILNANESVKILGYQQWKRF
jgi:hypothetical protein